MVTKIWLKGKTKGSEALIYPDCFPLILMGRKEEHKQVGVNNMATLKYEAKYLISEVARVEFRPE